MKRLIPVAVAALLLLFIGAPPPPDSYRVHYTMRGSGQDIIVQAGSRADARHTITDLFAGAAVTGTHRIK
jgi:hypothetical protein